MRGRVSIAVALVLAVAVTTAAPVTAATTAVGGVHTTDSDFNNAAQLTNVSVSGSGQSAKVVYNGKVQTQDSFETTSPLADYTNTGNFGTTTNRAYDGSVAVEKTANDASHEGFYSDSDQVSGSANKTASVWVYHDGSRERTGVYLAEGSGGGYVGYWDPGPNGAVVYAAKVSGPNSGFDASQATNAGTNLGSGWYQIHLREDGSTITAWLENSNGVTVQGPVSLTDSTYDTRRPGVWSYDTGREMDQLNLTSSGGVKGTYVGGNHSVDRATTGWTNLSLDNTTATVTWQGSNGGGWTDVATNTYSSSGNKTQSLSGSYSRWRVNVTFQQDGTNPSGALYDEGVLFSNREPIIDNSSASPSGGTTLQTGDPTLSINVSDPTFPTSQGDEVNVSFYVDGSYIGSSTITSNSTVTQQVNGLTGGSHSWYAIANDSYGGSTTSQTFSFNTPAQLEIRNESQPSKLVANVTTELEFYYKGDPVRIENKSTSDGTVDFTNLPTDRSVVVVADAPDYQPRRIFIDSLIETQKVYLLPKSKQSVTVTFELRDFTGEYPDEPTVLKVQRAINGSWETVEGDYFGASGSFPTTLRYNVRHRLVLLNTDTGERRVLGSYTPVATTTEVIVVKNDGSIRVKAGGPLITVDPATRSLRATNSTTIYAQVRNNSYNVSTWNVTATYRNETETTVLAQTNRTTQSGTYEPTLALAGRGGGDVTVVVDYTLADGTTGQKRIVYAVREEYNNSNSLLASVGQIPGRYPAQHVDAVTTFFAVLGSLMMAFGVASVSRASSEIVGLVAIVSLAGFAIIGWVGYGPVFVSSSAWVAMTAIRRGI